MIPRPRSLVVDNAWFRGDVAVPVYHDDVRPLLAAGVDYDPAVALEVVQRELVAKLPGDPWKGTETARS